VDLAIQESYFRCISTHYSQV